MEKRSISNGQGIFGDGQERFTSRKTTWLLPLMVFLLQWPILIGYVEGWCPVHPIVILLPAIGWLNFRGEKRGLSGLGIARVPTKLVGLLVLVQAVLTFLGYTLVCVATEQLLPAFTLTVEGLAPLLRDALIGVFIVALWEESVNRGYIQTRLQSLFGFWGVLATMLLFTSLHSPSAWQDFDGEIGPFAVRLSQVALMSFLLSFAYWRSGSVVVSFGLHAASNVAYVTMVHIGSISYQTLNTSSLFLYLLWTAGQVVLIVLLIERIFPERVNVSRRVCDLQHTRGISL